MIGRRDLLRAALDRSGQTGAVVADPAPQR
jgi:hypothetical protein